MARRPLPQPEVLTPADVLRLVLALVMIPLGAAIVIRTMSIRPTVLGVLAGFCFMGFGVYRLWLGWSRYRVYRREKRESIK
jgi:hypothetical protein